MLGWSSVIMSHGADHVMNTNQSPTLGTGQGCSSEQHPPAVAGASSGGTVPQEKLERAKRNKERALELRRARERAQPYTTTSIRGGATSDVLSQERVPSIRDSHAGFMLEDNPTKHAPVHRVADESVPALPDALLLCSECGKKFAESYLFTKFQLSTCDRCREPDGRHALITKTEAKQRYLLKDCDFEERNGPPLSFLLKKNPHSTGWGEMKLYLVCQVEARSHEVWGGEEGLEAERVNKIKRREKRKEKKYAKDIKDLRRAVRASLVQPSSSHQHTYPAGEEVHNPDDDTWTKTCSECGYQVTFEKM